MIIINLYAKYEPDGAWLPLETHLNDTAFAADYLYNYWLPDSTKEFLEKSLGLSSDEIGRFVIFLAKTHDIGKATLTFQTSAWKILGDSTIQDFDPIQPTPEDRKKLHHSTSGAAILKSQKVNDGVVTIIGSHHGRWRNDIDSEYLELESWYLAGCDEDELFESDRFSSIWKKLIEFALNSTGFSIQDLPKPRRSAQILLIGLLNMADWLASNTRFFPLLAQSEQIAFEDLQEDSQFQQQRNKKALRNFEITPPWEPSHYLNDESDFIRTFSFIPRSIQKDVIDILDEVDGDGLMIIEAPMGCGKTEAALYAAQILAYDCRSGGLFYGLPTVATSNGIMPRIIDWAEQEGHQNRHSFQLVHGKTMFNETYQDLRHNDFDENNLVVSHWMERRKLQLCPNFVIGTIDHLLRAVLKHSHIMLDHIGLAGKVVILDEIHSYDAYMNQYLYCALEWLSWYKVPVILLSATLPASLRKSLIEAYLKGKGETAVSPAESERLAKNISYPLVTFVNSETIKTRSSSGFSSQTIYLKHLRNWDGLKAALLEKMSSGGCCGIIVNTVRQAQILYENISSLKKDGFDVRLFHSRFTDSDRAKIENDLIRILGKPEKDKEIEQEHSRDKLIVIGTQVLEQSLDIDFDWMITEICPIDLLFQRIGRLHRHERRRPANLSEPCCWITGNELEQLNTGTRKIYTDWILQKTLRTINVNGLEEFSLPSDIPLLVNAVYEDERPTTKEDRILQAEYENLISGKEEAAQAFLLAPPAPEGRSSKHLLANKGDSALFEQTVRDCGFTIEVILVTTDFCENAWSSTGAAFKLSEVPDHSSSMELLLSKIKLPFELAPGCNVKDAVSELENLTQKYFSQWLKSKLIYGELILPLDCRGIGRLRNYMIQYSSEKGLEIQKRDKNEGRYE